MHRSWAINVHGQKSLVSSEVFYYRGYNIEEYQRKMKFWGVFSLALLALFSNFISYSFGAIIDQPKELDTESEVYLSTGDVYNYHGREKRTPQQQIPGFKLSGGGGSHAGTVRLDGERTVFNNDRTKVDANGFAQRSWQQGLPPQNSFGAGATVNQNIWKGKGGERLDAYGGYQRQWNTPDKHNAVGGIRYTFG